MGMTIDEIRYRLQAMTTMCIFQDAVGHDLSQKEIKLYNQAKDEAIDTMRKYQKIAKILNSASYTENGTVYSYTYDEDTRVRHIREVIKDE